MTSRLDELFSPDRLRRNWQASWKPEPESPQLARNVDIQAQYRHLLDLIAETFPDTSHLAVLFDEINQSIVANFPPEAALEVVDGEKRRMVELLEQLEELLWALSLPKEAE